MIVKDRKKPMRLEQIEALLRRLPANHPKRAEIEADQAKQTAGFRGEQKVDYFLSFLDEKKYHILHDLRLLHNGHAFQIDTLIISPTSILIIEIKNFSGTLFFEKSANQFIQIKNQIEKGFTNPLFQARRHKQQFLSWLSKEKWPHIPIEYLVVMSNPATIVKTNLDHRHNFQQIIFADQLAETIMKLEKSYQSEALSKKEIQKLSKNLIKKHTTKRVDILSYYRIAQNECILGVQCPLCHKYPMLRVKGRWQCRECQAFSKTAHALALKDYFLLIQSEITNQECRGFLRLPSRKVARGILQSMAASQSGQTKSSIYTIPPEYS